MSRTGAPDNSNGLIGRNGSVSDDGLTITPPPQGPRGGSPSGITNGRAPRPANYDVVVTEGNTTYAQYELDNDTLGTLGTRERVQSETQGKTNVLITATGATVTPADATPTGLTVTSNFVGTLGVREDVTSTRTFYRKGVRVRKPTRITISSI